jgi:ribonuclease HII
MQIKVTYYRMPRTTAPLVPLVPLDKYYTEDPTIYEIGVDEAGRGPLFGRVYSGAVVLPKDDPICTTSLFDHSLMKDSKKFYSVKKIKEASDYIKTHALAWCVAYEDETTIDEINILQATQSAMHKAIKSCIEQLKNSARDQSTEKKALVVQLLIDGNYFKPVTEYNKSTQKIETVPHLCIEKGDGKYSCIAAASILAKVARDEYIDELCQENPYLAENYGIDSNKGYGAKKHLDGIKHHGITQWHRKSYAPCKN